LSACDGTDPGRLDALVATLSHAGGAPVRDDDDPLPRGTTIRHFVVLERIGAGGMGIVYAAYDYGLDRRIALKLVRDRGGATARARLLREAQALAKLSHPNVVAVYDVGQHGDDVYVAMELVEGTSLRAWLAAEPRGWRAIVEVFRRAGAGLAAAHDAGIVHRDVKPDNILIGRDGAVRVGDFGLAVISTSGTGDRDGVAPAVDGAVTVTGAAMGTPAYMAPEQHAGAAEVDHRADQFGFCVALYEALHGVRPFAGDDGPAVRAAIAAGRFAPGAPGTPGVRDRDVPAWLRRVVQRGLASEPAARFPSMARLVAELGHDPQRRRRRSAQLGAALLLVAGVGLGSARLAGGEGPAPCSGDDARLAQAWSAPRRAAMRDAFLRSGLPAAADHWLRVERALDERAAGWQRMRIDACEATQVRREQSPELLDLRMACLDDRATELRALTDQLIVAERTAVGHALDAVRGLERLDACARGATLRAGGHRATDAGAGERRERLARAQSLSLIGDRPRALELARTLVHDAGAAADRELEGQALLIVGRLLMIKGDVPGAEQALYGAVAAAQAAAADELAAKIWLELVWLIGDEASRPAEAQRFARIAQGAIDRLGGAPQLQAVLEDRVGVLFYNEGKYAEAAPHLARGLALREQVFGPTSTQAAVSQQHVALLRTAEGQPALALELHRRAREHAERALGPTHPDVLTYANGEAAALFAVGKLDEALALLERTLAAVLRNDPDDERAAADLLTNIAVARRTRGELATARVALERALAMHERTAGPDSVLVAAVLSNLGLVLADLGQHEAAQARLGRALAIQEHALGPDHPDVAETHSALGAVLMTADQPGRAIASIDRAIAIRAKLAGLAHDLADDRFRLARALVRVGRDRRRALALAGEARAAFAVEADRAAVGEVDAWQSDLRRGARR
jgi:tetratricopeptide (TPR) repeat protein